MLVRFSKLHNIFFLNVVVCLCTLRVDDETPRPDLFIKVEWLDDIVEHGIVTDDEWKIGEPGCFFKRLD